MLIVSFALHQPLPGTGQLDCGGNGGLWMAAVDRHPPDNIAGEVASSNFVHPGLFLPTNMKCSCHPNNLTNHHMAFSCC
jgi:hypothetical protein